MVGASCQPAMNANRTVNAKMRKASSLFIALQDAFDGVFGVT